MKKFMLLTTGFLLLSSTVLLSSCGKQGRKTPYPNYPQSYPAQVSYLSK